MKRPLHPVAHIAGIGLAVPPAISTERFIEIDREVREAHGLPESVHEMAASLARGTGIQKRHTIHPAFTGEVWRDDVPDIFTGEDFDPSLGQRLAVFQRFAPELALEAARKALKDWGGDPNTISHVITTATSGWIEPGLACALIEGLDLRHDTRKCELNFNGCFCGATCLRLARDTIRGGESGAVLIVAMEMSFTHYEPVDTQISTLVANALFADGAAAVVVASEGQWRYDRSGMSLVPNTGDYLTFSPPLNEARQTYEMFLHRDVGARIARYLREPEGAPLIDGLIELSGGALPALAVHPGGPNILEAVLKVLVARGWEPSALDNSFHTLHNYGNLGSAAMLFVLARTLAETETDHVGTMAFGPGVTVEWGKYSRV